MVVRFNFVNGTVVAFRNDGKVVPSNWIFLMICWVGLRGEFLSQHDWLEQCGEYG
jgi:hypothetical protein